MARERRLHRWIDDRSGESAVASGPATCDKGARRTHSPGKTCARPATRSEEPDVPRSTDPVLRHARREALIIFTTWLVSTAYCCGYSYLYGYIRPDRPLGPDDVALIF